MGVPVVGVLLVELMLALKRLNADKQKSSCSISGTNSGTVSVLGATVVEKPVVELTKELPGMPAILEVGATVVDKPVVELTEELPGVVGLMVGDAGVMVRLAILEVLVVEVSGR